MDGQQKTSRLWPKHHDHTRIKRHPLRFLVIKSKILTNGGKEMDYSAAKRRGLRDPSATFGLEFLRVSCRDPRGERNPMKRTLKPSRVASFICTAPCETSQRTHAEVRTALELAGWLSGQEKRSRSKRRPPMGP